MNHYKETFFYPYGLCTYQSKVQSDGPFHILTLMKDETRKKRPARPSVNI